MSSQGSIFLSVKTRKNSGICNNWLQIKRDISLKFTRKFLTSVPTVIYRWKPLQYVCTVSAQIYGCSQSVRKYHMKIDKIDVICTQKDGKNLGKNDVFIKYNFSCFSDWTILAGGGGGGGGWRATDLWFHPRREVDRLAWAWGQG